MSGGLSDRSRQSGTSFAETTLFHWLFDAGVACQIEAPRWMMGTNDARFRFTVVVLRSCRLSMHFFSFQFGSALKHKNKKAV